MIPGVQRHWNMCNDLMVAFCLVRGLDVYIAWLLRTLVLELTL